MSSCSSCGSPIPDGQGSSCSMCYGDPHYGSDGYYMDWCEEQENAYEDDLEYQRRMDVEQWKEEVYESDPAALTAKEIAKIEESSADLECAPCFTTDELAGIVGVVCLVAEVLVKLEEKGRLI